MESLTLLHFKIRLTFLNIDQSTPFKCTYSTTAEFVLSSSTIPQDRQTNKISISEIENTHLHQYINISLKKTHTHTYILPQTEEDHLTTEHIA